MPDDFLSELEISDEPMTAEDLRKMLTCACQEAIHHLQDDDEGDLWTIAEQLRQSALLLQAELAGFKK